MFVKDGAGNQVWKPSLKQERFLSIPASVKEALYGGALMAGKTDVLLMYPIVHKWHEHENFKGLFLRRTMPELRNEVIPRAKLYFRAFGATFNKTDSCFTFPSGALYFFGHCENEDDVHNYDSMEPNYAAFDELTSFTEWMYLYVTIERVRVNKNLEGILPAIVRSGTNPGNIGHPFVYKRFIKPYPQGGKILKATSGAKRIFIPANIDDNPHASEQYKRELDELPEAERRAKKYGDWTAYEGQVFSEFRDKHYPGEPEHAVHLIKPFEIPAWWPKILAIDWGFNAMCSVGFGAVTPSKQVVLYRHLMFFGKKIEEWAPEVKYFVDKEQPKDSIICHSANQNRGDPHTIQEQVAAALDIDIRLGVKDRVGGKILLHEFLRWEPRKPILDKLEPFDSDFAAWLLRNKGRKEYEGYLNLYKPQEAEMNLPKLLFFDLPDVKVITEAIKACVYAKSGTDGKKKEDVAEFEGDDPYDMIRMLIHAVDDFFGTAQEEHKKLEAYQEAIKQFQLSQDMTQFYRNMKRLDNESFSSDRPLQRFNRRKGFYGRGHRVH